MQKIIRTIILVLLFLTISCLYKNSDVNYDSANSGIVLGENHSFIVRAPEGWVLDNSSGVNQGIHAAFYPKGGSWEESPTVMYAQGVDIDNTVTLEDFIETDIEDFENEYPGIKIESLDSILIKEVDRVAKVVKFSGGGYESTDAVAYIKEKSNISMFVLSTKIPEEFDKYYSKFIELIQNYKFLTSKVNF